MGLAEHARMLTGMLLCDAVSFLGQDDATLSYKMVDDLPFDYPHSSAYAKSAASRQRAALLVHRVDALLCGAAV